MAKHRSAFLAMVCACVLALGAAQVASAVTLKPQQEGLIVGWHSNGSAFAEDSGGHPIEINKAICDERVFADGEILFHFYQASDGQDSTVPNPGGETANTLDVDLNDGEILLEDIDAIDVSAHTAEWLVRVDPPGDELELVSATSNVDGGELRVLGICIHGLGGASDAPTEPTTSTVDAPATSAPGSGLWLLVVALGVLLAGSVVVTPARTRSRRQASDVP